MLNYDVRERSRDLDEASARLNRRIAALTAETEAAARHAEATEKRANARGHANAARVQEPAFIEPSLAGPSAARAFLAALSKLIDASHERAAGALSQSSLPMRAILGPQTAQAQPAAPARLRARAPLAGL